MNLFEQFIKERQTSEVPLIIWGSAVLAKKTASFLRTHRLSFDGFAVNEIFYHDSELDGSPIFKIEDYVNKNICDIIIGFGNFKSDMLSNLNKKNINHIYEMDLAGILVLDEINVWGDDFFSKHQEELYSIREKLSDTQSQKDFDSFVEQKRTGCYTKEYAPNALFDEPFLRYNTDEIFIDCGAYHGESSLEFIKAISKQQKSSLKKIFAVEPESTNIRLLKKELSPYKDKIEIVEAAVGNKSGYSMFSSGRADQSRLDDTGDQRIAIKKIDDFTNNEKVSFIKMDVEGAEIQALQGAVETIKRNTPKLAISIYHRPLDLFHIYSFINSLSLGYNFYFRNYMPSGVDSILFAIK